jgi:N-acetyl-anhydromuramyl-L-alanine amidase AmpD
MRTIDTIVLHCSASPNGAPRTAADIDAMHYARGFRRALAWRQRQEPTLRSVGYHWLIAINGGLLNGRHLDEVGAHAKGHNLRSIGICIFGTDKFTLPQWDMLRRNLCTTARVLAGRRGMADVPRHLLTPAQAIALYARLGVRVVGHRDLSPDLDGDGTVEPQEWLKICPGFDVAAYLAGGMVPPPAHVLEMPQ